MLRHREKKRERERNENRVKVTTLYIDLLCSLSPIHTESINQSPSPNTKRTPIFRFLSKPKRDNRRKLSIFIPWLIHLQFLHFSLREVIKKKLSLIAFEEERMREREREMQWRKEVKGVYTNALTIHKPITSAILTTASSSISPSQGRTKKQQFRNYETNRGPILFGQACQTNSVRLNHCQHPSNHPRMSSDLSNNKDAVIHQRLTTTTTKKDEDDQKKANGWVTLKVNYPSETVALY